MNSFNMSSVYKARIEKRKLVSIHICNYKLVEKQCSLTRNLLDIFSSVRHVTGADNVSFVVSCRVSFETSLKLFCLSFVSSGIYTIMFYYICYSLINILYEYSIIKSIYIIEAVQPKPPITPIYKSTDKII